MKPIKLEWSKLSDLQRQQVVDFTTEVAKNEGKKAFIHDMNNKSYYVNSLTGNVAF